MYPLLEDQEQGIGVAQQALDEVRNLLLKRTGSTSMNGTDDKDLALQLQFESLEDTLKEATDACYAGSLAETGDGERCGSKADAEILQSIVATARGLTDANVPISFPSDEEDAVFEKQSQTQSCTDNQDNLSFVNSDQPRTPPPQMAEEEAPERSKLETAETSPTGEKPDGGTPVIVLRRLSSEIIAVVYGTALQSQDTSTNSVVPTQLPTPQATRGSLNFSTQSLLTGPKISCTACGDRFPLSTKHLRTPCGHTYCKECAANLVEAHNKRESLHPLRCCTNTQIPNSLIEPFLNATQIAQFRKKIREYQTPHRRRVYCPGKGCNQFVKLGRMEMYFRRTMICPACSSSICVACREMAHPGSKCNDSGTIFTQLVKDKGWQTCPNCRRVVERTEGCLHMTCLCRFEFCYQCGAKSSTKCGHGN